MDYEIKKIYENIEHLKRLNKALSDESFFEQRGYQTKDIPKELFDLSFPVKNPIPFVDRDFDFIIDIGCGSGLDIYLIKKQYPHIKVIGIDLSMSLLIESKKFSNNLICCNATSLPFKSGLFSMAIMNGVFNLISDKDALILEVNRILSNGGILLISDLFKSNNLIFTSEADLFNLGKAMMLEEIFERFKKYGFSYEFGEYEKEVAPEFGIFTIKWRKK
ncbi:MAG: class I SAM-dependent methyltransferase [Proteobacteria bacterium]|nr:class I SAM-dependent methyltransferase [Pseudomonadota bacterium]